MELQKEWGSQLREFRIRAGYCSQGAWLDAVSLKAMDLSAEELVALQTAFQSEDVTFNFTQVTISRWETGTRKPPRKRDYHLYLIWAMVQLGGIGDAAETDAWLALAGLKPLTPLEKAHIWPHVSPEVLTSATTPLQRPPRVIYFQARQAERDEILAQLQPGNVATICGAGGMGKSALAAEVLWTLSPHNEPPPIFPDGIVFHSFYNQPQATSALEHIATSFGEETRGSSEAAAQRALSQRTALLLLDGAEDADNLAAVLAVRNNCGVLITTRNRSDAVGQRLDLAPLATNDAVALLRDWAADETISDADAAQIVELVGRQPLAVRLAGRYLAESSLNAADFAVWLTDSPLTALDHGNRRAESVPLLLEQSVAQVSKTAQDALALIGWLALTPFPNEAMTKAFALENKWAAPRALGELVKFGLLHRADDDTYAVSHALIHTYARRRLQAKPEHCAKLVSWLSTTVEANQSNFALLDTLRTHVVTLQARCAEAKMWDSVDRLARAIEDYLDLQGIWTDQSAIIQTAVDAARANSNRRAESKWLGKLGLVYRNLGSVEEAISYFDESLAIAREVGDKYGETSRLDNLGVTYANLGEMEKAIGYFERALLIAYEIGDRHGESGHLGNLGIAYTYLGEVEKAIGYFEKALLIAYEIGDRRREGRQLGSLGDAYRDLGEVEKSISYTEKAIIIFKEIGDRRSLAIVLDNLGLAYVDLGKVEKAISYYKQGLAISREIGDKLNEGVVLGHLGSAYADLGHLEKAISCYDQGLSLSRESGDKLNEGLCLGLLGNVYLQSGQVEIALVYAKQGYEIASQVEYKYAEGIILSTMGQIYMQLDEKIKAKNFLNKSLDILEQIKSPEAEVVRNFLGKVEKSGTIYAESA